MELVVVDKKCVKRILGLRRFKRWTVYVDAIALLVPMITYITDDWSYQMFCMLRLRLLYDFHHNFCRSFKVMCTWEIKVFLLPIHLPMKIPLYTSRSKCLLYIL